MIAFPQVISSTPPTTRIPFFSRRSTAWGLWMMGPSEWIGSLAPSRSSPALPAVSSAMEMARLTPKQKPALRAMRIRFISTTPGTLLNMISTTSSTVRVVESM